MSGEIGFRTERLKLCDVEECDLEQLRDWFVASRPERMTSWPVGEQTIEAVGERFINRRSSGALRVLAIRTIDGNRLIGRVSYFNINRRSKWVEFGIMLGESERGKGLGREVSELLLHHLFSEQRFNKVMAQTAIFNNEARALLESMGFKIDGRFRQHHELDGTLHDSLYYSLLASEFIPTHEFIDLRGEKPD